MNRRFAGTVDAWFGHRLEFLLLDLQSPETLIACPCNPELGILEGADLSDLAKTATGALDLLDLRSPETPTALLCFLGLLKQVGACLSDLVFVTAGALDLLDLLDQKLHRTVAAADLLFLDP